MNQLYPPYGHRGLLLLALPLAAALLTGCSKPPGCSDSATADAIAGVMLDNVKSTFDDIGKDDPNGIMRGYIKGLKVSLTGVVSNGYNSEAKKNFCRATLTVNTASGESLSRETEYTTQKTEDKGGFLVEVGGAQAYFVRIVTDAEMYFGAKRYQGEWPGTYSCQGIDGAADGPQGPFSMPVTMVVNKNMNTKIERTTKGGGVETIAGEIHSGEVSLVGEGSNSPDDTWQTAFSGKVQGMDYAARGEIKNGKELLRACTLQLTLPSN